MGFKVILFSKCSEDVNVLFLVFLIGFFGVEVGLSILFLIVDMKFSFSLVEREVLVLMY